MKATESLVELIKRAESSKPIVNSAKQQISHVMRQMPIYSGYYVLDLVHKKGGTDWISYEEEDGNIGNSCRLIKDIENGSLYLANENYVPIRHLTAEELVRVASCLCQYDYGKTVTQHGCGGISFNRYKKNYLQDYIYVFYSAIYKYVKDYLEENGDISDNKFGVLSFVNGAIKWNGKLVPHFPILININPFIYTTSNFIEKNCYILLEFFDKIKTE